MEEGKNAFKSLTGKHTGKRTLGRSRRRWENKYIITDLKEVGVNISHSPRDREY